MKQTDSRHFFDDKLTVQNLWWIFESGESAEDHVEVVGGVDAVAGSQQPIGERHVGSDEAFERSEKTIIESPLSENVDVVFSEEAGC